ncbi:MAG TPA: tRNA uridine-5-carboxymethylaminomethyl(34) synthesis enzyme MnmG, partial [Myxococcota bacterium]|nr:tRNA uridine-5-carboxymethylaminomethyl(34) synthesis enzyme MnmG [Myxococcota bacterium]
SDAKRYRLAMGAVLQAQPGVTVVADEVVDLLWDDAGVRGVATKAGATYAARAVVITTGTFLNGLCHIGAERFGGGRVGDAPASFLSTALRRLGLNLGRFKTGTTPRLAADSIAWDRLELQPGDEPAPRFSFERVENTLPQVPCHITYTGAATHAVIRDNLHRSPLYGGIIQGTGPRYCPSLEDKIVRFSDKDRHQIFLEPEGLDSDRIYPNGLSTSLPRDVQEAFLRSIPGLEAVRILQHGYAVEYDYVPPTQLLPSLMTKALPGLFLAGQINGTSGYEEAAAQGLMAGLNATRYLGGQSPAVLGRDQAYMGVLIDDLVTKGVDEPYRVFTSRAEHRLTLRESNAEERLSAMGHAWGLVDDARWARAQGRRAERDALQTYLARTPVGTPLCLALGLVGSEHAGKARAELLRRPDVTIDALLDGAAYEEAARVLVEEEIKYAGYIAREQRAIERLRELEEVRLPLA